MLSVRLIHSCFELFRFLSEACFNYVSLYSGNEKDSVAVEKVRDINKNPGERKNIYRSTLHNRQLI